MCLAQGHNTVTPVRLEPVAPRSGVTTLPLSHSAPYIGIMSPSTLGVSTAVPHFWFLIYYIQSLQMGKALSNTGEVEILISSENFD